MHAVAVVAVTTLFLILTGSLWYSRPNPHVWLFGALALGCGWGYAFFRLITRDGK